MFSTRLLSIVCAIGALVAPAMASTVTVTSPSGLTTTNGTYAPNTWYADDMRTGGSGGITTKYADNGNGSLQFNSPNDFSTTKADFAYYFSKSFALSDLTAFSYDFYRSSTLSGSNRTLDPALRLYVSNGNGTSGSLVYEPIYNSSSPDQTSPMDQFVFANAFSGVFWGSSNSLATSGSGAFTRTLAQWQMDVPNLSVIGITTGIGSGWYNTFDGAVDNITYGVRGADPTTFNFESAAVSATPEPSSIFLLGSGLVGVGGAFFRKRKV